MTYGQQMKYPYTLLGKFLRMPWKYYWVNGRAIRYTAYALVITLPLFWKIDRLVNSPANVEMWKVNRQKRLHDPFAPVTDEKH